jgi:hypothetical protein
VRILNTLRPIFPNQANHGSGPAGADLFRSL